MRVTTRVLIFGLILCLILISGWTFRSVSDPASVSGNAFFCFRGQAPRSGISGPPETEKTVILNGFEWFVSHAPGERLCCLEPWEGAQRDCVFRTELPVSEHGCEHENDPLNLLSVAPRA